MTNQEHADKIKQFLVVETGEYAPFKAGAVVSTHKDIWGAEQAVKKFKELLKCPVIISPNNSKGK